MICCFSPALLHQVASAISEEVRAKNNDYVKRGVYDSHTGLHCFSPVINIMRHPLWGRNQVLNSGSCFGEHQILKFLFIYFIV